MLIVQFDITDVGKTHTCWMAVAKAGGLDALLTYVPPCHIKRLAAKKHHRLRHQMYMRHLDPADEQTPFYIWLCDIIVPSVVVCVAEKIYQGSRTRTNTAEVQEIGEF